MADSRKDARRALSSMDNAEKARLLAGADFWSTAAVGLGDDAIPPFTLTDGPCGVRKQVDSFDNIGISESLPATCFPSECTSACTFDDSLLEMVGRAIGEECRREDVAVVLGPGLNIKRHPLGGRNFEYFSEDPLLAGRLGAAAIRGVQSTGVSACMKHFAANSQETMRMTSDSVIDERTLNDIYLRSFEIAVREGRPNAAMTAYNRLNGTYCTENPELLRKLRDEWGFDGMVVTDWGALSQSVPSVAAGLDLCMSGPRPDHVNAAAAGVEEGALSQEALDRAAESVATLALHAREAQRQPFTCDFAEHLAVAQIVAEAGAVLLKNDGVLPISEGAKVALIGEFAERPRYQGSGSSKINPIVLDNAVEAFADAGVDFEYARGYDAETGETDDGLLAEAVALAADADIAVVYVGLPDYFESEGIDRAGMELPEGMDILVSLVAEANPRTVAVVCGGGPVTMPWRDDVAAILAMQLAGCRSGHAAVNLLTGVECPSGKLAETWPHDVQQTALGDAFPVRASQVEYVEGPFVGYRYYDAAGVEPAFPFGFGLSYTEFEYSDLEIIPADDAFRVSCMVCNVGERAGAEVVQVYVAPLDAVVPMAPQSLAGYAKVYLEPGETRRVSIDVARDAFSYWDVDASQRRVDEGEYEIRVSASSRDVRLKDTVRLGDDSPFEVGARPEVDGAKRRELASYYDVEPQGFVHDGFLALYGRPLPAVPPKRPFTIDSPMSDLRETAFGRGLLATIKAVAASSDVTSDKMVKDMLGKMFEEMPLRTIMTGGIPYQVVEALMNVLNGRPWDAIRSLFRR